MGHSVPAAKRGFPLSKCLLTYLLGLIDTRGPKGNNRLSTMRKSPALVDYFAQRGSAGHGGSDLSAEVLDRAASVSGQRLLHLHCLEHHNKIASLHRITVGDGDLDDRALHW